jgi:60S ribosome subunit biogenesis protein NIP7
MFRKACRQELTILRRAFNKWGVFDFLVEKSILIKEERRKTRKVCLLSCELEVIILSRQPDYAGLKIGELKKNFLPSMEGADLIARVSKKFPHIVVDGIAERLVLYGRSVLGQSIVGGTENLNENEVIILLNGNKEPIGIGRTKYSGKYLFQIDRDTVTTLVDAGHYLRSEGQ